jgi:hypothetical protein
VMMTVMSKYHCGIMQKKMVGDLPRLAVLCSSLLCRWFCFPTLHGLQAQISEGSLQQTCEMPITGERISGF